MKYEHDVVVVQMPGSRLLLGSGVKTNVSFQALSEKTLFFESDCVDKDLKKLGILPETVKLKTARLSVVV